MFNISVLVSCSSYVSLTCIQQKHSKVHPTSASPALHFSTSRPHLGPIPTLLRSSNSPRRHSVKYLESVYSHSHHVGYTRKWKKSLIPARIGVLAQTSYATEVVTIMVVTVTCFF